MVARTAEARRQNKAPTAKRRAPCPHLVVLDEAAVARQEELAGLRLGGPLALLLRALSVAGRFRFRVVVRDEEGREVDDVSAEELRYFLSGKSGGVCQR